MRNTPQLPLVGDVTNKSSVLKASYKKEMGMISKNSELLEQVRGKLISDPSDILRATQLVEDYSFAVSACNRGLMECGAVDRYEKELMDFVHEG